jgi:hypothetical protein
MKKLITIIGLLTLSLTVSAMKIDVSESNSIPLKKVTVKMKLDVDILEACFESMNSDYVNICTATIETPKIAFSHIIAINSDYITSESENCSLQISMSRASVTENNKFNNKVNLSFKFYNSNGIPTYKSACLRAFGNLKDLQNENLKKVIDTTLNTEIVGF